jgi:hypothetical protein
VHAQLFAKLLVVSAAESSHWCAKNTAKLSPRIVVVKNVCGREFLIFSNAIDAFDYVDSIFVSIEQCVNITQFASPGDLWLTVAVYMPVGWAKPTA